MTPAAKRQWTIFAAAATILAGLWPFILAATRQVDARYVHTTDYRLDRRTDSLRHDSEALTHNVEVRDIYRALSSLDSSDRCSRGLTPFCR